MIYYGCPKCQTPMASPDSLAGQSDECPECGNVATVPSSQPATAQNAAPPVVSLEVSSGKAKIKQFPSSKEKTLYAAHPAMFRNNPIGFILCIILIPAVGIGLAILIVWWIVCKGTELRITERRTTIRSGILSKHTNEIRHYDVRNLQVKQSFFQRLFGVGTLDAATAGQAGVEIHISGIPNPKKAAQLIRERQEM